MQMQLSFDYDSRANESIAYYGGDSDSAPYRVRMVQDICPENPFESWDCNFPMITDYQNRGHDFREYDNCKGAAIDSPLQRFSDWQIIRFQRQILAALSDNGAAYYYSALTGARLSSVQEDLEHHKRAYRAEYVSGRAGMAALLRDYFSEALSCVSDSDKLETLSALYDLIRIPNLCTSSSGYSQGDYAELLIVATPESLEKFGWDKARRGAADLAQALEAQADLYGAWAWGDVYGYIAERAPLDPQEREDSDAWEEIDSCWGFYGDNPEKSGLAESALSAIEYDKRARKAARLGKLKELIRANAPLAARQSILAAMA